MKARHPHPVATGTCLTSTRNPCHQPHEPQHLAGPGYHKLFYNCYAPIQLTITPQLLAQAGLLVRKEAEFACHETAAQILRGIVPAAAETHLGAVAGHRSRREGLVVHRYLKRPSVVRRRGVPVTDGVQTFLDLATLELVDLVILGDSLLRVKELDLERLHAMTSVATGRGARRARQATTLVRARVDSPQETRTRLLLVLAGLPEPVVDLRFHTSDGELLRRLDLAYPQFKVAVEYDGRPHIERERNWQEDIVRREWFTNQGWRFVIVVADDIFVTPQQTVRRVADTLQAAGAPRPRLSNRWLNHFPGRAIRT